MSGDHGGRNASQYLRQTGMQVHISCLALAFSIFTVLLFLIQDNVRTNAESVQRRDFFFERAYFAPKHTEVTINTSLTSFAIGYFLLVVHCNQVSISKRFRDIRPQKPVCTHRHTDTRSRVVASRTSKQEGPGSIPGGGKEV